MDNQHKRGDRIFAGALIVLGLVFLGFAFRTGKYQLSILTSWPRISAEVKEATITNGQDQDDQTVYSMRVKFRYTVNGKQYETSSGPGYSTENDSEMKSMANVYAPGSHHPIRYNPTNPKDIRFNAGALFPSFLIPVFCGVAGIAFSVWGAKRLFTPFGRSE